MIQSLSTGQFRNLDDSPVRFEDSWSLIVGDNGAGKTSLLEALYLAATSKSFLTHKLIDCCRAGSEAFSSVIETAGHARHRLRFAWSREEGLRRSVNDNTAGLLDYLEAQPLMAYTARDAELLDGAPAARRRFLDANLVNQRPATIKLLARLRSIIESKRAALTAAQPLEPWNEMLAPVVIELQSRRRDLIVDLQRRTTALMPHLGFDDRKPQLVFQPSRPKSSADGGEDDAVLTETLNRRQKEERQCGYPLWGPQRDDWSWTWDGIAVGRRSSAGERKALTLALFVACCQRLIDKARPATLLIDDLDSELDSERRARVCSLIADLPQVIATSSKPQEWSQTSHPITHRLATGRVSREA